MHKIEVEKRINYGINAFEQIEEILRREIILDPYLEHEILLSVNMGKSNLKGALNILQEGNGNG